MLLFFHAAHAILNNDFVHLLMLIVKFLYALTTESGEETFTFHIGER